MTSPTPREDLFQQQLEQLVEQAGSAAVFGTVQFLMKGGATANQAMRLAAFALVADLGRDALKSLGIAPSTATRWRAEIRKYRDAAGGIEAMDAETDVPRLARLIAAGSEDAR